MHLGAYCGQYQAGPGSIPDSSDSFSDSKAGGRVRPGVLCRFDGARRVPDPAFLPSGSLCTLSSGRTDSARFLCLVLFASVRAGRFLCRFPAGTIQRGADPDSGRILCRYPGRVPPGSFAYILRRRTDSREEISLQVRPLICKKIPPAPGLSRGNERGKHDDMGTLRKGFRYFPEK